MTDDKSSKRSLFGGIEETKFFGAQFFPSAVLQWIASQVRRPSKDAIALLSLSAESYVMGRTQVHSILDEIDPILARLVPRPFRVPLHALALKCARRGEQAMLARIPDLCAARGRALDIGANHGLYTYALARHARRVEAFEPQAECISNLSAFARAFAKNVTVHPVAVSDEPGVATLNVPRFGGRFGPATISGQASLDIDYEDSQRTVVPKIRIDDFGWTDVSFLKIDVEGHEARVITGATKTMTFCRPTMLIEIEQRHLGLTSIQEVFTTITDLGYRGGFYRQGAFFDLASFDVTRDQTLLLRDLGRAIFDERYINMFVFIPHEHGSP